MKRKLKLKDTKGNVIHEGEVVIPDKDHLEAQRRYPSITFRNRKKYYRPTKHKQKISEND